MALHRAHCVRQALRRRENIYSNNIIGNILRRNSGLSDHQRKVMAKGLPKQKPIPLVKDIVLVASGKGGVGKSTTAVNLALAISSGNRALSVGILDADVFGPSIPTLMNLNEEPELDDRDFMVPLQKYGIKCMSMGFLVPAGAPIIWRGLMVMSAIEKMLRKVAWGPLDYLIIDMPPGTGDTQLSVAQLVPVSGAVIVTTPQDLARIDAKRGAEMFKKVNIPVLGIVENMSYFVCQNCQNVNHIFGKKKSEADESKLEADILGEVPLDGAITETSDNGTPIVISHPESLHSKVYKEIADHVIGKVKMLEQINRTS